MISGMRLVKAAQLAAVLSLAPVAAAQSAHPAVIHSEAGWNVLQTVEGCYAVMPQYALFLFGDDDPGARLSWTGACTGGFVNGPGSLVNDYTIPPSEWGSGGRAREQLRGTASAGIFDGAADEASFSSFDYGGQYAVTEAWDGFSPPSGMTWHDGGDVRNPMPRYYRQGCSFFVSGYKGEPGYEVSNEADYGCQPSTGAALRDAVRASLTASASPPAPGPVAGSSGNSGSSSNSGPAAKSHKVHNPAMDRTQCVRIEAQHNPNAAFGVVGDQRIINGCGETVEAFWCNVDTECSRNSGNTWTLSATGPGSSWPIDSGLFNYGACKGANSGGFDKDSQGQTFTCPEWPDN